MPNSLGTLLRSARTAKRLTQQQVGDHVGITYSAVGQYETGTIKRPRADKLASIAAFLDIDRDELNRHVRDSYGFSLDDGGPALAAAPAARPSAPEVEVDRAAPVLEGTTGARDVPELGIAVGGDDGDFTLNGERLDFVPRPVAIAARDVFAVRVKNDSMSPRFEEGHLLYVESKREPRAGEDGIIELLPEADGAPSRAFIKQIVSKNSVRVVARQFNPAKELTFERSRIKAVYRVVPNNELFGV